ncbi:MAG TPA: DUF2336 domain-containing protein [Pseudolabrys sp.]|nr:DUF2336 domain-containing protein [Pseudolabrys sp.]
MASSSLLPELEDVVQNGTPERRAATLARITSLFLDGAPRFSDAHVALFDDVILYLIEEIESQAVAELARRLAPVDNAPAGVVRRLANDDDIAIAGPILEQSRLDEPDLKFIAETKSQAHLLALSARKTLSERISDIIVNRGDRDVSRKMAANPGARLSNQAFATLVTRAHDDDMLAEKIGSRADIPPRLFRELLLRATDVVRQRLLATARPETQAEIRRVLDRVSADIGAKAGVGAEAKPRNYTAALEKARALHAQGQLAEAELASAATARRYEDMIATLSVLCDVPVEVVDRLLAGERPDPVLILGRCNGFAWDTVRAIVVACAGAKGPPAQAIETARENFEKLTGATAQRVVRFWQLRPGA